MHYDSTLNGIYKNDPVMKKKDGSLIQINKEMSQLDFKTLNEMYPCYQGCNSGVDQGNIRFRIISVDSIVYSLEL